MEISHLLIRFGELTTKGKNRKYFVDQLHLNLKYKLKPYKAIYIEKKFDRMFIHLNGEDAQAVAAIVKTVFGIVSFSLAIKTESTIEAIKAASLYLAHQASFQTFKIETKRKEKVATFNSDTVNRDVATAILSTIPCRVDVKQPDLCIKIEILHACTYVMGGIIKGAGGYPVGSNGRALLMLSGGIDSPVAGYLTLKKGVVIEAIHFASLPYTSVEAIDKVKQLMQQLCSYGQRLILHIVPFTALQVAIHEHCDANHHVILTRRMMYRIATQLALKRKLSAIITGESIGQVASQTLKNIQVVNEVTNFPIFRPLISYDKIEIMALARQIGTYDISILPYEDCCTVFKQERPTLKAHLGYVGYQEKAIDFASYIETCLETVETHLIQYDKQEVI